jgi:tetratricopeptide (TPR) repeat protein
MATGTRLLVLSLIGTGLAACQKSPPPSPAASPQPVLERAPFQPQFNAPPEAMEKIGAIEERLKAGDRRGAIVALRALHTVTARSSDVAEQVSRLYDTLGFPDRALFYARQAVRLAPDAPTALLRLADLEQRASLPQEAGQHLRQAAAAAPTVLEIQAALAQYLESEEHPVEAERHWHTSIALDPQNPGLLSALAANLGKQKRYAEARATIDRALALAPEAGGGWFQRAALAREEARIDPARAPALNREAEDALGRCLEFQPGFAPALFVRGCMAEERGDDIQARASLEPAYQAAPDLPTLRVRLAQVLLRTGDAARGEALLRDQQARDTRAEKSRQRFGRLGERTSDPETHRALARWCFAQRDSARAALAWAEVLRLKPGDTEAANQLARLRTRRGDP